ncbi:unnamed protein product [Cuscuta campestris]|uniref:Uncharacterized protein n=1 Tax=Cuscuta campestris TaxID=132261 RepID=A0A484LLP3_9ASTE|nr:unnamed protein product [Cuscuta campestris]
MVGMRERGYKKEEGPCHCLSDSIMTFASSSTANNPLVVGRKKRRGLLSSIDCQSRLLPTLFSSPTIMPSSH